MKRNVKVILFSLVGLAILGGTILVLNLTQPKAPDGGVSESSQSAFESEQNSNIVFTDFTVEDVASIRIENKSDEGYTIVQDGEFSVQELDLQSVQVPYSQQLLTDAATSVTSLVFREVVEENAEDLSKYGFSDDSAKVTAVFNDGSSVAFTLGDNTPSSNAAYILIEDGVYTVSTTFKTTFEADRYHWVETKVFPSYDTAAAPEISRVTITRQDLDVPMVIESIPELPLEELRTFNSHKLTSPLNVEIDPEKSVSVLYGLFELQATTALWVAPDAVDYELAGLSEPYCTVEVIMGGETYTFSIGGVAPDGGIYGLSSYVPDVLFSFDGAALSWLSVTPADLIAEMFLMPYIYSVETVTVEYGDNRLDFGITGDAQSNKVTFGGEKLSDDDRDRFGDLYRYLISVKGEKLFTPEDAPESSELIARIIYTYRGGLREPDVLEYYTADNRRSIIRINGTDVFTCRDAYTNRLVQNLNTFVAGGGITLDW